MTYKFVTFQSTSSGELDDKGYWDVLLTCKERASVDGEEWEEQEINFRSIDRNFDSAHKTTLRAYMNWMDEFVYKVGCHSILEAERKMKVTLGNITKDNKVAVT